MNKESKKVKALLFGLLLAVGMFVSMTMRNDKIKRIASNQMLTCRNNLQQMTQQFNEASYTMKQCLFLYSKGESCEKN